MLYTTSFVVRDSMGIVVRFGVEFSIYKSDSGVNTPKEIRDL